MHPPTKDQTDIGKENQTLDASDGVEMITIEGDIIVNKDMARQEHAEETDINHMLSRFGVTPARGAPAFGEWDETINLQSALESVAEARAAFKGLPTELQQKFGTMEDLLRAYHNGQLIIKDEEIPERKKTETELLQDRIDELQRRLDNKPRIDPPMDQ